VRKREFLQWCGAGVLCGLAGAPLPERWRANANLLFGAGTPDDGLWRWSKEALFVENTGAGIHCLKCPNGCTIPDGGTGICRNRVNVHGTLYSIAYGNPCAVHVDPIEKKPLMHFLPGTRAFSIATAGCNLSCLNCQNWQISQVGPKETDNTDLMPKEVVDACVKNECASIAYTYGEPTTFYEYAYDTAVLARRRGIRNVWKSNGYIEEGPLRQLCGVIDAANIDLKSFDDSIYGRLNAGTLAPVLRTLRIFHEMHVWLEITNLVIPGWTDDVEMIRRMCDWLVAHGLDSVPLHFTRFLPLYKLNQVSPTPVKQLEDAHAAAVNAGMKYVYIGNVPGHPREHTYCHQCGKMILERRGYTIVTTHMIKGHCAFCHAAIPGVWSPV
jgi:pyruvate formate lyase activating enzyme